MRDTCFLNLHKAFHFVHCAIVQLYKKENTIFFYVQFIKYQIQMKTNIGMSGSTTYHHSTDEQIGQGVTELKVGALALHAELS